MGTEGQLVVSRLFTLGTHFQGHMGRSLPTADSQVSSSLNTTRRSPLSGNQSDSAQTRLCVCVLCNVSVYL